MQQREILINGACPPRIGRSEICEMVLKTDYFRTDGVGLYKVNFNLGQWDAIAKKDEATEIRSIFSDEWQARLDDALVGGIAKCHISGCSS